jgi:hypothetical protein
VGVGVGVGVSAGLRRLGGLEVPPTNRDRSLAAGDGRDGAEAVGSEEEEAWTVRQ